MSSSTSYGLGRVRRSSNGLGIPAVLEAAALIATGQCHVVLVVGGSAGIYTDRASTAPWTRPTNEFVVGYGMFTAVEFALMAKRHMLTFGTTSEQLAIVAATIRNNGHENPGAVYAGRGPFTPKDILASRPIAEPFHLMDCSTTSEGAVRWFLLQQSGPPTFGGHRHGSWVGQATLMVPRISTVPHGTSVAEATEVRQATSVGGRLDSPSPPPGLSPSDVDVCELYDPFSFEIIRQLEAFGFCPEGEGGSFVEGGAIAPTGVLPVTTDGGTMSFAHPGNSTQMLQRVIRAVEQVRGSCRSAQVAGAEVALCSNGGSGALFTDVMLIESERP